MSTSDRNIVLITSDSLRADHCGFINDRMDTTATLDRMANDGVVFENAIAPGPRTPSSIPEISTGGLLPKTRDDLTNWKVRTARIASHVAEHETLAEKFSELGYTTAAYTANPWTNRTTNFDKGFDYFQEVKHEGTRDLVRRFSGTALTPIIWASRWLHKDSWFSQWPTFYEDVIRTTKKLDSPYFLWVFLMDTHTPYIVPRRDRTECSTLDMYYGAVRSSSVFGEAEGMSYFRADLPASVESSVKRAYRDATRSVDRFVGDLWSDLRADDPVFVFHSDHGEAFNEHGTYGHQQTLYEENVHVPLLLYNTDQSATVGDPFSLRTLPDLLESYVTDGAFDPSEWTTEYAISRTENSETMSVRGERWKYITSNGSEELYDLVEDPRERRDLATRERETVERLRAVLESYKENIPERDHLRTGQDEPDEELRNRLESLGYLG